MDWLNYHHLLYFWMVAKEGGITQAAEQLHLAQPTLSSQIKRLEKSLEVKLFDRVGRSLVLTEAGRMAFRYADEIFTLGRELTDALQGHPSHDRLRLIVGVPHVLPKLVVYQLLKPVLELPERVQLVCHEGRYDDLLSDLAMHKLDVLLTDAPLGPASHIRGFNHLLGECGVSVLGTKQLAKKYQQGFPQSLHEAPLMLPTQNTSLRRMLEKWFDDNDLRPMVMHEFEDSAILKVFGQAGEGLFFSPSAIEKEVAEQYKVQVVGRLPEVRERFYAISVERRLNHPAIVAISQAARTEMFVDDQ